jgi:hypothetical protein
MNVHNAQSSRTPVHRPNTVIAVSFHRLFLGGLLPSRARFRFAGSPTDRTQTKLPQFRASTLVSQFTCLNNRVQFNRPSTHFTAFQFALLTIVIGRP